MGDGERWASESDSAQGTIFGQDVSTNVCVVYS